MNGMVWINLFIVSLVLLSCNSTKSVSKEDKDVLANLPKSEFVDSVDFKCINDETGNYSSHSKKKLYCEGDSIIIYERNYSLDTIINNYTMKLIIHRHVIDSNINLQFLSDVNFLIAHINRVSTLMRELDRGGEEEDLGEMIFCDSISIDDDNCNKIFYKYWYSYFSGGGSSTKGVIEKQFTVSEFREWSQKPMSSDAIFDIGI